MRDEELRLMWVQDEDESDEEALMSNAESSCINAALSLLDEAVSNGTPPATFREELGTTALVRGMMHRLGGALAADINYQDSVCSSGGPRNRLRRSIASPMDLGALFGDGGGSSSSSDGEYWTGCDPSPSSSTLGSEPPTDGPRGAHATAAAPGPPSRAARHGTGAVGLQAATLPARRRSSAVSGVSASSVRWGQATRLALQVQRSDGGVPWSARPRLSGACAVSGATWQPGRRPPQNLPDLLDLLGFSMPLHKGSVAGGERRAPAKSQRSRVLTTLQESDEDVGRAVGAARSPSPAPSAERRRGTGASPHRRRGTGASPHRRRGTGASPHRRRGTGASPERRRGTSASPEQRRGTSASPEQRRGTGADLLCVGHIRSRRSLSARRAASPAPEGRVRFDDRDESSSPEASGAAEAEAPAAEGAAEGRSRALDKTRTEVWNHAKRPSLREVMERHGYDAPPEQQGFNRFQAATFRNGWQLLCIAEKGDLPDDLREAAVRGYRSMKRVLEHGGVTVIRVGVRDSTQKKTEQSRAFFHSLVHPSATSLRDDFKRWQAPFKAALLKHSAGVDEAVKHEAERRMEAQQDRITETLAALKREVPKDFGALWVMIMLEAEVSDVVKPPNFSIASFRYLGEDEFAVGAGGRGANLATIGLNKHLQKAVSRLNLETQDYGPDADPRETYVSLYIRAFGFASPYLGREKLAIADESRNELSAFVADCERAAKQGLPATDAQRRRANSMLRRFDLQDATYINRGTALLSPAQAHILTKFLNTHCGGVEHRVEARAEKEKQKQDLEVADAFAKLFQDRQAGPEAIPSSGAFYLEDGRFDPMLPTFLDDALSRGRWICFRLETEERAEYSVVFFGADDGSSAGGCPLEAEFSDWQASVPTEDGKPLRFTNLDQVPSHRLRTLRTAFNASRKRRYDDAMAALQTIPRAATLCACRFQPPLKTNEEACLPKPTLFDYPTTWSGSRPEPRITLALKALKMKLWLLQHKVLKSDFLRDAHPGQITTYEEAVSRASGGLR